MHFCLSSVNKKLNNYMIGTILYMKGYDRFFNLILPVHKNKENQRRTQKKDNDGDATIKQIDE